MSEIKESTLGDSNGEATGFFTSSAATFSTVPVASVVGFFVSFSSFLGAVGAAGLGVLSSFNPVFGCSFLTCAAGAAAGAAVVFFVLSSVF